jgi:hypothetical protein
MCLGGGVLPCVQTPIPQRIKSYVVDTYLFWNVFLATKLGTENNLYTKYSSFCFWQTFQNND